MAQVTVQQLAETVGASVERLLLQMKEAGLPHGDGEEAVSDEDKKILLSYLKRSHGETAASPKRITLKRKTVSTLRTGGTSGKKTVNVEVRKKRTYVKRDVDPEESPTAQEAPGVMAATPPDAEVVVDIAAERETEVDPETARQRAAEKRLEEDRLKETEAKKAELAAQVGSRFLAQHLDSSPTR